jgi:hypothetical protein
MSTTFQPTLPSLPGAQCVVEDDQAVNVKFGASVTKAATLDVGSNVLNHVQLPSTTAPVESGQVITIGADDYTFTVVAGVVTNIVVS